MTKHYIYIIECQNGAYYTGYTIDMERRYQEHVEGSAKCKYTRSFPPKRLAAFWEIDSDKSLALKLECKVKALTKSQKKDLMNDKAVFDSLVESCRGDGCEHSSAERVAG